MILLIAGGTHSGKTLLAQRLMEKYHFPYLSIDHLKMGLIRSNNTDLTPLSTDEALTAYLWPIVREMIKTAIENNQNLIIEGCYIPFEWKADFDAEYLKQIRYLCLILSTPYIQNRFSEIKFYANAIEERLDDDDLDLQELIRENEANLAACHEHQCYYYLIKERYEIDLEKIEADVLG